MTMAGPRAAAIVPAYNEAKTVGDVVRTLVASGAFAEIIVVSDGSTDGTAAAAREAGATLVHEFATNRGKGGAMGHGVMHTDAPVICFFDADLVGLTVGHVRQVLGPVVEGKRYMNVGLRDRGAFLTALAKRLPLVGGERALRRPIFDAIPDRYLAGYGVESALNWACRVNGLPYGYVVLDGLGIVTKPSKVGWLRGIAGYVRMWSQVAATMLTVRFARREFAERGTHMSHRHL
jgi:glycosyltransferase involved in cell wall biosynthesis